METARFKYSSRKMEAAEPDGDKLSAAYVPMGAKRHNSSRNIKSQVLNK